MNEEQASAIMKNHLSNMAAIDKATDEERTRRVMALEMRLAERRALARQKVSYRYMNPLLIMIVSLHCCGGAVASWLVRSPPNRAVRVRALLGNMVLCS